MTYEQILADPSLNVAGIDEAGRGPLAGPVVAAAVILPKDYINADIQDSKKLSAVKRDKLYAEIKSIAIDWQIVAVGARRIDKLNILRATLLAMKLAGEKTSANFYLIDGNQAIDSNCSQLSIVKGDSKVLAISAASILAKVYRDKLMKILDQKYPGYNLSQHSGYPTKLHKLAVAELGASKIHRRTFRGVKEHLIRF